MSQGPSPRFHLTYVLLALFGVLVVHDLWEASRLLEPIPYSAFQTLVAEGKVQKVTVGEHQIEGELKEPAPGQKPRFVTTRVDPDIALPLGEKGVEVEGKPEDGLLPVLLSWVLPAVVFFGLWMLLMRRLSGGMGPGGGLMAIGKSKAKVFVETGVKVSFKDVAGVDEAKVELQEIVAFLKDPAGYGRLGARMPRGVLLVGPPGTGKTLLARAVAGEAGVPFFSISGSEFVEMFVGVGAARVRDLFEQARQKAPCIIFIDELDALGRARQSGGLMGGGHDEKEQTLNQLLVEMDGFDPSAGIVLIGATNRPEILDPALLRAGRFDRQVLVDRPDRRGRADILAVHMVKIRAAAGASPESIAALTPGFTGADLANLVNEAALVATRRGASEVTMGDFTLAIERIVAGLEKKNRLINPREREVVAYHEMGHAILAAAMPGADPVHKISIIPRGVGALGYTIQRPTDDRYLMTKQELENKIAILLGGRAAEHVVFEHLSTGAADDLSKATEIARSMATRYAMLPELGNIAYDTEPQGFLGGPAQALQRRTYSEETAREIDCALRAVVADAFARARRVLERSRPVLDEGARLLLAKETLDEGDLAALFARVEKEPSAGRVLYENGAAKGRSSPEGPAPERAIDPAR
jgi:cell division protease FtsH